MKIRLLQLMLVLLILFLQGCGLLNLSKNTQQSPANHNLASKQQTSAAGVSNEVSQVTHIPGQSLVDINKIVAKYQGVEIWLKGYNYNKDRVEGYFEIKNPSDKLILIGDMNMSNFGNLFLQSYLISRDGQEAPFQTELTANDHGLAKYQFGFPPKSSRYMKFWADGLRSAPEKMIVLFPTKSASKPIKIEIPLKQQKKLSLPAIKTKSVIPLALSIKAELTKLDDQVTEFERLKEIKLSKLRYNEGSLELVFSILANKDIRVGTDLLTFYLITDKGETLILPEINWSESISDGIIAHKPYTLALKSKEPLISRAGKAKIYITCDRKLPEVGINSSDFNLGQEIPKK